MLRLSLLKESAFFFLAKLLKTINEKLIDTQHFVLPFNTIPANTKKVFTRKSFDLVVGIAEPMRTRCTNGQPPWTGASPISLAADK